MKKIVRYIPSPDDYIVEGHPAVVHPVDHPDAENVTNTKAVLTSRVVQVHADGFETQNSYYIPVRHLN